MTHVTLTGGELQPDGLPPVCAVCGEYADRDEPTDVVWSPLLIFFGLSFPWMLCGLCIMLVGDFLAELSRGKVLVHLPVCVAHRGGETRRKWLVVGLAASTWVSLAVCLWTSDLPSDIVAAVGFLGTAGWGVVAMFGAGYFEGSGVRATEVRPDAITLAGVHPAFVAAVENARQGEA